MKLSLQFTSIMKKLLLLPFFFLTLFTSCSTEDTDVLLQDNSQSATAFAERAVPTCMASLSGFVEVDVTSGLGSPVLYFVADTDGAPANVPFTFAVDIQSISECEDIESGYGRTFRKELTGVLNPDVNMPAIQVNTSDLPAGCYRWRIVAMSTKLKCANGTEWYEAPLL